MITRRIAFAALAAVSVAPAEAAARSVRGRPAGPRDLQGFWTNLSGTPLERPREFATLAIAEGEAAPYDARRRKVVIAVPGDDVGQDGAEWFTPPAPLMRIGGQARTSVIVDPADGKLPYSPAGRRALGAALQQMSDFSGPETRTSFERCLIGFSTPADAPMLYAAQTSGGYQFVQTQDHLVIRAEANHDVRIVSLQPDSTPMVLHPWMGVSIGGWEGATLVVETSRFNEQESLRSLPELLYLSAGARVVERFTRTSPGEILYDFTVDDPAAFTRPWRGEAVFRSDPQPIYEYACHEGNYALTNELAGARRIEQDAAAK
ncbi:MAG TPA: hypothetical protein VLI41_02200 [Phenylobacterium sp.]|uniref:hypothetical protein n=1 Tax=Phenylobacterium sp. TaxID=1871053 RepID=UPI002CD9EAE7|nr:hypothetical protein [Phenylobacterium sp.]HSV01993.1 hypothetical protein [Phenylobacterium sp.]